MRRVRLGGVRGICHRPRLDECDQGETDQDGDSGGSQEIHDGSSSDPAELPDIAKAGDPDNHGRHHERDHQHQQGFEEQVADELEGDSHLRGHTTQDDTGDDPEENCCK